MSRLFDFVYQGEDFLLIDKQPNVSVHKDNEDKILLSEVCKMTGDNQIYLIHRLDKMTSGLLLLGRNKEAARELSALFANKKIQKYYLAVSSKKPRKKQGLVIGDMVKSRRRQWRLLPTKDNPAITQFFSCSVSDGRRLFLCRPHTGKTHQIRVMMKSIGSSILGDEIYGGISAERGYLHAFSLQFTFKGEFYQFYKLPQVGRHWGELPEAWLSPEMLPWPRLR